MAEYQSCDDDIAEMISNQEEKWVDHKRSGGEIYGEKGRGEEISRRCAIGMADQD